jgi:hypothetical protein
MFQDFQAAVFAHFVSWTISADFSGVLLCHSADAHKKVLHIMHQNMPFKTRIYQNMPKCPKMSKYAFICKIKIIYLLLEPLN